MAARCAPLVSRDAAPAARVRPARPILRPDRSPGGLLRSGGAQAGSTRRPRSSRGLGHRAMSLLRAYRHAMPVLGPIESFRRARSSGVGCARITHMKRTVASSTTANVSARRKIGPRRTSTLGRHRRPAAWSTNTRATLRPKACAIAWPVAVILHRRWPSRGLGLRPCVRCPWHSTEQGAFQGTTVRVVAGLQSGTEVRYPGVAVARPSLGTARI